MMMSGCGTEPRNWNPGGMMPTTCAEGGNANVPPPPARIHRELAPECRFVAAESPLPKCVGKNHGRRAVGGGFVLLVREPTSAHRLNCERLKYAVGDFQGPHALRLTANRQRRGILSEQADSGERSVLLLGT